MIIHCINFEAKAYFELIPITQNTPCDAVVYYRGRSMSSVCACKVYIKNKPELISMLLAKYPSASEVHFNSTQVKIFDIGSQVPLQTMSALHDEFEFESQFDDYGNPPEVD